ncbi:unnamed protein product [Durusdinium trenchii]|uniref:Uncharacterized protein n=1 Tax=Durusdinium trenchii TaxID=1381693 RepID=A0ABP0JS09_9DINO
MAEAVPEANGAEKNDGRAAMVLRWCCGGRGEVDEDTSSAGKAAAVVGDLSLETTAVPGEADNLLDKILKNALAPKVKPENLKKEGVKSEVKSELIKSEVKTEKGIKQEKLDGEPSWFGPVISVWIWRRRHAGSATASGPMTLAAKSTDGLCRQMLRVSSSQVMCSSLDAQPSYKCVYLDM